VRLIISIRSQEKRRLLFLFQILFLKNYEQALRITGKKHDLISISITDPRELSLPSAGIVELLDAETGETVLIDTSDANFRKGYSLLSRKNLHDRFELFRSANIDYIDIRTDVPYIDPIMKFFRVREKRL